MNKFLFLTATALAGFLAFGASARAQSTQCVSNALAGGTVDHITIPLQPCALNTNILILTAAGANTIAQPTLQMAGYPQQNIYTSMGTAPGIGAIPGAGAVIMLTSTGTSWKIVSGNASTTFSGVLAVPNGGTGLSTITTNSPLIGEGTGNVSTITPGTTGQFLGGNTGSPPSFKSLASNAVTSWSAGSTGFTPSSSTQGAITLAGTLGAPNGGTGFASYTTGDTLYASSSSALSKLGIGSSGQYYKVVGGLPAWATLSSDAVTTISFGTTGLTPNSATSGAVTVAGTLATTNGGTGQTSYTNGQLLIGNTGTGGLSKSTLTAGANMIITNSAGGITLASTGVSSGCGPIGSAGEVLTDNGSGGCASNSGVTISANLLSAASGLNLAGTSSPLEVGGSAGTVGQPLISAGAGATPTFGTLGVSGGGTGVGTLTGIPLFAGTAPIAAAVAGTDYAKPSVASTWTAKQTFAGTSSVLAASLVNASEPATISASAATGTINYDVCVQSVLYYTLSATANWTLNLRCSSGTSLDAAMATGDVVTVTFLTTQGVTPFYNNALQVDGNAVTPKCQGTACPVAGNASGIDAYTYAVVKTGSAAFTVLESQTQFK